ncbi:helix-turn-helix transcriptional regulator [uncultured Microscilla sp.]|uniref:helix-turn-helix domain-containing protein n=1 Tax=uncultured Microscilla sp. TaxID=432653 RepID=UPI0026020341|nr:helix-turn-helix transcriptional regulator [uncultured Microscilla sp.]
MELGERIKNLRTKAGLTQKAFGEKVGINYIQIGRYETKKATPSTDILNRIADALNTTTDFLMNGAQDEKAIAQLQDKELLQLFRKVEQLDKEDKNLIKTFLDALITKRQVQRLAK